MLITFYLQESDVLQQVKKTLNGEKVDGIICVAGGWAGGNAANKDFIKNCEMMWKQSVWSSTIAASIAAHHLKDGGFLSLTGAKAALEGTPGSIFNLIDKNIKGAIVTLMYQLIGMMGYGMAKGAVHQLTKSLAGENSGLPANSLVASILPITLDTPMNRKWMPKADTTTWTSLEFVAEYVLS